LEKKDELERTINLKGPEWNRDWKGREERLKRKGEVIGKEGETIEK
jgi:hypothetical protein